MVAAREALSRLFTYNHILHVSFISLILVNFCKLETHSLYKPSDPMVQFSNDTIIKHLSKKKQIWMVEFYSSWCGHCQSFAPKWTRLSYELKNWNKYINVGVIDCAAEKNLDTCTEFKIEAYPTIRFFDPGWQKPDKNDDEKSNKYGILYEGDKDLKHIRRGVVDQIEKQNDDDFPKPDFKFIASQENIDDLIVESKAASKEYIALVFEEPASYTGRILTLDASDCNTITIKRVSHLNVAVASKYGVAMYPSLILITLDSGEHEELSSTNRTHTAFLQALNDISKIVTEPPKELNAKDNVFDELEMEKAGNDSSEVYMIDLVSSIAFSLRREIPKKDSIEGPALDALKNWVNLLAMCFPSEQYLSKYLQKLDTWLKPKELKLKKSDYLDFLDGSQESKSYLPSDINWKTCEGSKPRYRGFPCSLWVLFHTLTVNCGKKVGAIQGIDVLKRIRGFIDYFFGCRYCRDHFIEMAKNVEKEVNSNDDAIIWLWKSHNLVNARLKGEISSDPLHPKIQFPPDSMCEECRKPTTTDNTIITSPGYEVAESKWNKKVTLEFLKEHYGPDNIRIREKSSAKDPDADADADAVRRRFNYVFYTRSASPSSSYSIIGLSRIDMSMCLILYVCVILVVIALYVYFIRRRVRKTYKHYV